MKVEADKLNNNQEQQELRQKQNAKNTVIDSKNKTKKKQLEDVTIPTQKITLTYFP